MKEMWQEEGEKEGVMQVKRGGGSVRCRGVEMRGQGGVGV